MACRPTRAPCLAHAALALALLAGCGASGATSTDAGLANPDGAGAPDAGRACLFVASATSSACAEPDETPASQAAKWLDATGLQDAWTAGPVEGSSDLLVELDAEAVLDAMLRGTATRLAASDRAQVDVPDADCRTASIDACTGATTSLGRCRRDRVDTTVVLARGPGVVLEPGNAHAVRVLLPFLSLPPEPREMPEICRDSRWVKAPPTPAPEVLGVATENVLGIAADACFWIDLAGTRLVPGGAATHWSFALLASARADVDAPSQVALLPRCDGAEAPRVAVPTFVLGLESPSCGGANIVDRDDAATACGFDEDLAQTATPTFCRDTITRAWGIIGGRIAAQLATADCDGQDVFARARLFFARTAAAIAVLKGVAQPAWQEEVGGTAAGARFRFRLRERQEGP